MSVGKVVAGLRVHDLDGRFERLALVRGTQQLQHAPVFRWLACRGVSRACHVVRVENHRRAVGEHRDATHSCVGDRVRILVHEGARRETGKCPRAIDRRPKDNGAAKVGQPMRRFFTVNVPIEGDEDALAARG